PVARGRLLMHDHDVPRENAIIPHGLSLDPQGEILTAPRHRWGYVYVFSLQDRFDRGTCRDDAGHRNPGRGGQLLERRLRNSGDPTRSGFVSGDRHSRGSEPGCQLFLSKPQPLSSDFSEFKRPHVTNGYIDAISLSSVIESRLLLSAMF